MFVKSLLAKLTCRHTVNLLQILQRRSFAGTSEITELRVDSPQYVYVCGTETQEYTLPEYTWRGDLYWDLLERKKILLPEEALENMKVI